MTAERPQNFVAFGVHFRGIHIARGHWPISYTLVSESDFIIGLLTGRPSYKILRY